MLVPFAVNQRIRALAPSATLAINERCREMRRQGRRIFQLGFGQSPFPAPASVLYALRANVSQKDYLPVKGLPELRDAVAEYFRRRHRIDCTSEDVIVGPGSKPLLFLLTLVCEADLILPAPSWVSYAPQGRIAGRRIYSVETRREDGWRVTPAALEEFCRSTPERTRILVLNYPNNPTGLTYSGRELQDLAPVVQRYRMLVVSDEIYGELHHADAHVSMARFYPEGTIVTTGLSKWCGAGGWRLGTMVFPSPLRPLLDGVAVAAGEVYSTASSPVQYAAVRAFQFDQEMQEYLTRVRRILKWLGALVYEKLRATAVNVHRPEGGFYLFPDFSSHAESLRARGISSGKEFCERLLEDTGVAMLPGSDFGRPAEEFTARLAYVDFDGTCCIQTADPDEGFLAERCESVLTAIDLINGWIAGSEQLSDETAESPARSGLSGKI